MAKIVGKLFMMMMIGLILGINATELDPRFTATVISWDEFVALVCQNLPPGVTLSMCQQSATSTTASPSASTNPTAPMSSSSSSSSSSPPSPLENSHWCKFYNGSYIPRSLGFVHNNCYICRCTESHQVACTRPPCMTSYCIDNSRPYNRSGQCCSQCAYEPEPKRCMVNGLPFSHGMLLRQTSDNIYCWCQLGIVECRKVGGSVLSSLDVWGKGSAVYVIVIIICIVVILGSLLCLGSGVFFYYYYKKDQQATQQAYEQYYNSAGWQPMGEDGQVVDPAAEAKKAEAEGNRYAYEYGAEQSEQYIPPPYAIYNGAYADPQEQKS